MCGVVTDSLSPVTCGQVTVVFRERSLSDLQAGLQRALGVCVCVHVCVCVCVCVYVCVCV